MDLASDIVRQGGLSTVIIKLACGGADCCFVVSCGGHGVLWGPLAADTYY